MLVYLLDYLSCPACSLGEIPLEHVIFEKNKDDVIEGFLRCPGCGARFQIEEGVADLRPPWSRSLSLSYDTSVRVASYIWSHYADLWGDPECSDAYASWASMLDKKGGYALDAGCAAGRFTFELAKRSSLTVGVDLSRSFVKLARMLCQGETIKFILPLEGLIAEEKDFRLPDEFKVGQVDFLLADVTALPFRSGIFTSIASLNILDKVLKPLLHLKEIDRVASSGDAQFVFSDPFSWSEEVSPMREWLGGKNEGPFSGLGIANVMSILSGDGVLSPWVVRKQTDVWWKIRTHQNHFELIRSKAIKASRS